MQSKNKKLLVTGMFRSGTTMMAKIISTHNKINFASDPYFHFFKICRNIFYRKIRYKLDIDFPLEDNFTFKIKNKKKFMKEFFTLIFNEKDIINFKKNSIIYAKLHCKEIIPSLRIIKIKKISAIKFLNKLLEIIDKTYLKKNIYTGFKTIWIEEYTGPLLSKKFKIIHVIRDLRGVANSSLNNEAYGSTPLLYLIRNWRKSVHYSILNKSNKNYLTIKFEDIILKNKETLKKIQSFLELKNEFDINILLKEKKWVQNSSFQETKKGLNKKQITKWKKTLSNQKVNLVNALAEKEMKYMGYLRKNRKNITPEFNDIFENQKKFSSWFNPFKEKYLIDKEQINKELIYNASFTKEWNDLTKYEKSIQFNRKIFNILKKYS